MGWDGVHMALEDCIALHTEQIERQTAPSACHGRSLLACCASCPWALEYPLLADWRST